MDLSKITARVRPRNPYEAADLGIVMARQWFRPLMLLWLLLSLPLMLVLYGIFHAQPLWALLILWWLKPLFETLQLQFIAEALFNPDARWQDFAKKLPTLLRHQLLAKLFVQRWSLSRSFNMPVGELERLGGSQRARRLSTLHRGANAASIWLTLLGTHLEALLVSALFLAAWMLVPVEMSVDFEIDDLLDSPLLFPTLAWGGYLAMWIIAPFYVCCGFMLYINRRTWLEAWDIELTFRQLAARHAAPHTAPHATPHATPTRTLPVLLLGTLLLLPLAQPSPVQAESSAPAQTEAAAPTPLTPEQSLQEIGDILESDDFNQIKTRQSLRWADDSARRKAELKGEDKGLLSDLGSWLDDFFKNSPGFKTTLEWLAGLPELLEILLWGLVIALFIILIYRFRDFAIPGLRRQTKTARTIPTHLFGLELDQTSLPDDLIAAARTLWQQQRPREALGLLYRGALSFLVFECQLPLEDSHTEDECVTLCGRREHPARADYFRRLTAHWVRLAYAHQTLGEADFTLLCEQWPDFTHSGEAA